jgi:hypothetical protein
MAFYSGFFNSKGLDRTYTAEDFTNYLSSLICNGILDTYGSNFKLTAADTGLSVTVGTGKAWINGHYFINDARYSIDLSEYMDESLPRYVAIAIYLDTTESVRSVTLKLFPGTPAENPSLPSIPQDADHVRLLLYAVRLNPGATDLTSNDWYDYRSDENVCGYCKCILGKCRVTDLMAQMAQLIAEVQENNETITDLTTKVAELEAEIEDIGDIVDAGKCGDNVYYALYSNGRLLIKGTGAMYDFSLQTTISPFRANDNISRIFVADGVTTIGDEAFIRCMNIESVTLPVTLAKIGSGSFLPSDESGGSSGKLETLMIPDSVCEIGDAAFWGTAVHSVTIPHNLSTVGSYVFRNCSRLQTVRYEGDTIGNYMFVGCSALNNFTIANTVKTIGAHCFNYCTALESINYEGSVEQWQAITKKENWDGKTGQCALTRIQCLDGFMEWDADSKSWKAGEE